MHWSGLTGRARCLHTARETAAQHGWPVPSYATVHAMIAALEPAVMLLAHEGSKAHAQRFDLLHRREAARPNEICEPTTPNSTFW